jgi:23S rRNA (uridine2552-2'-O)-methyltransferase
MTRSKTSKSWLKEHFDDVYVKMAQKEGYRSRAVYKLLEIQEKTNLIKPGMTIVDLGAAPGGWSQVASKLIKGNGEIVALDLLAMEPLDNVTFIQGDFCDEEVFSRLMQTIDGKGVDLVLSDIAPNMSGNKGVDIPRSMYLAEIAFDFATRVLKQDGLFLMKVFHGEGFEALLADIKKRFKSVALKKPKASRARSRETYLLGKGFKKNK